MKQKKTLLLSIALMMVTILPLCAQEKTLKRKVAIGRFSNETQYSKSVFYDKENDPMGKQASDILSSKLASTEKFLLIERQDYDKIVNEVNTGNGDLQKIGADFIIIGSITEFGRKTIGTQGFMSQKKEQIVEVGLSVRMVDVSTGLVVYSEEAKGQASVEDKQVLGFGKSADYDATLSDKAISAAISKLVENIINKCMDIQWKAYFLAEDSGAYFMSGGASQGIVAGDIFTVMSKGKKVKNPQTGITIELPGKVVGKVRVEQTAGDTPESEISIVSVIEGSIDPTQFENYFITDK